MLVSVARSWNASAPLLQTPSNVKALVDVETSMPQQPTRVRSSTHLCWNHTPYHQPNQLGKMWKTCVNMYIYTVPKRRRRDETTTKLRLLTNPKRNKPSQHKQMFFGEILNSDNLLFQIFITPRYKPKLETPTKIFKRDLWDLFRDLVFSTCFCPRDNPSLC